MSTRAVSERRDPDQPLAEDPDLGVLNPVDRVSEMMFGLLMALTFIGAVSAADPGREQVHTLFTTALGCNLAWGLVDAVMYLVRTIAERGRLITLVRSVRDASDAEAGRAVVAQSLSRVAAGLVSPTEIESVRSRIVALPALPARPRLVWRDGVAAVKIFVMVVVATFPVVLPFLLIHDVDTAKTVSRGISLIMLFLGGLALGRYAGYGTWKTGLMMAGLGTALIIAINALGG